MGTSGNGRPVSVLSCCLEMRIWPPIHIVLRKLPSPFPFLKLVSFHLLREPRIHQVHVFPSGDGLVFLLLRLSLNFSKNVVLPVN